MIEFDQKITRNKFENRNGNLQRKRKEWEGKNRNK